MIIDNEIAKFAHEIAQCENSCEAWNCAVRIFDRGRKFEAELLKRVIDVHASETLRSPVRQLQCNKNGSIKGTTYKARRQE